MILFQSSFVNKINIVIIPCVKLLKLILNVYPSESKTFHAKNSIPSRLITIKKRPTKILKWINPANESQIAVKRFLKVAQDLINFNILNILNDLKAVIIVKSV